MKFTNLQSLIQSFTQGLLAADFSYLLINVKEESDGKFVLQQLLSVWPKYKAKKDCIKSRVLNGDGLTPQQFLEECEPNFLFESTDILLIDHAEKIKASCVKGLHQIISSLKLSVGLVVFICTAVRSDHSLLTLLEQQGCILDLAAEKSMEREKRIADWVRESFYACGKEARPEVCMHLLKHLGTDQSLLQNEIGKLSCFVGERAEVTVEDIQAVCPRYGKETIWQWGEAFLKRDGKSALRIGRALIEEGQFFLLLLKTLRTQFQTAFQVAVLLHEGSGSAAVQKAFPYMRGRILENHCSLAAGYGLPNFTHALLAIDQTDLLFRNGVNDPEFLMELLISKITILPSIP